MTDLTQETIDSLKAQHGELRRFTLERGGQPFVARAPQGHEFERALDKIAEGGKRKTDAILEIGAACLVFPPRDEVSAIAERKPGLYLSAGNVALEMAGVVDTFAEKL